MSNESLVTLKEVTVVSGVGQPRKTISTTASVWSQLQNELHAQGVSTSNAKAIIGETENTLESADAVLPNMDFHLFIVPEKVKSGYGEDWSPADDEDEDDYEDNPYSDEEDSDLDPFHQPIQGGAGSASPLSSYENRRAIMSGTDGSAINEDQREALEGIDALINNHERSIEYLEGLKMFVMGETPAPKVLPPMDEVDEKALKLMRKFNPFG